MRLLASLLVLIPALLVAGGAAIAGDEPRLVAATFRSAWCGPCRVLEPHIEAAARVYDGAPIEFIRFDFTYGERGALARRAEAEGIEDVYADHAGATGFMLLIDRETGDVLARITMRYRQQDIAAAIDRALEITARREDFGL